MIQLLNAQLTRRSETSVYNWLNLLAFLKPYWLAFVLAFLSLGLLAASEAAFPALLKPLLDKGFSDSGAFPIWSVPFLIVAIFVVRGIFGFTSSYLMNWIANNLLRDLRSAMFKKLVQLPSEYFDTSSSSKVISRIVTEVNGITVAATNIVTTFLRDSLIVVGLLAWMLYLNPKLTIVIAFLVPALMKITYVFSKRMRRSGRESLEEVGRMTQVVQETAQNQREIKVFQLASTQEDKFARINSAFRLQQMKMVVAQSLQTPLTQLTVAIGISIVVTIALFQARAGLQTVGDFVSFIAAMLMMMTPIRHLTDINAQLQRGLASAESVFKLLSEPSEGNPGKRLVKQCTGHIEFRNVGLIYQGKHERALSGVNLSIRPGQRVAFVGGSGQGKSSLVSLLPRFYRCTEGEILLDGIPIQDLEIQNLRMQISMVSQDPILFDGTILENLTFGNREIDDMRISAALEVSALSEFVESLPNGLNTKTGERGVQLSGGQRQRLAIARAILRDTPILILDEATSALDLITEQKVMNNILNLTERKTILVVTHRIPSVASFDQIVLLNGGSVQAIGRHTDLLETCPAYQALNTRFEDPHEARQQSKTEHLRTE
jgi:subfamily B ATP-binding cassette protein MsbA